MEAFGCVTPYETGRWAGAPGLSLPGAGDEDCGSAQSRWGKAVDVAVMPLAEV